MYNEEEEQLKAEPTEEDMQIISTKKATQLFGNAASHVAGVSVSPRRTPPKDVSDEHFQFIANDAEQCE